MKLDGKHIVITGATAIIGAAFARAQSILGATVSLVGRNLEHAEKTLHEIAAVCGRRDHRFPLADFIYPKV